MRRRRRTARRCRGPPWRPRMRSRSARCRAAGRARRGRDSEHVSPPLPAMLLVGQRFLALPLVLAVALVLLLLEQLVALGLVLLVGRVELVCVFAHGCRSARRGTARILVLQLRVGA